MSPYDSSAVVLRIRKLTFAASLVGRVAEGKLANIVRFKGSRRNRTKVLHLAIEGCADNLDGFKFNAGGLAFKDVADILQGNNHAGFFSDLTLKILSAVNALR